MKKIVAALLCFIFLFAGTSQPSQQKIQITLSENDWVTVIVALQELPYKQSEPIINQIREQASKQLMKPKAVDSVKKKQ